MCIENCRLSPNCFHYFWDVICLSFKMVALWNEPGFPTEVFWKTYELLISNKLVNLDKSITSFLLLQFNSVRDLCKSIYNEESKRIWRINKARRQREKCLSNNRYQGLNLNCFVFCFCLLDYKPLKGSKLILPSFICPVLTHRRHSINEWKKKKRELDICRG